MRDLDRFKQRRRAWLAVLEGDWNPSRLVVLEFPDLEAARRLLAASGYAGEPVSCIVAQDQPVLKAMGEVTADLLKRMGMTVDFVATDWGTVGARRAVKTPPGQGGWNMFHTWHTGAGSVNPASNFQLRANGDAAWFGWPESDAVEAEVTAWFAAKNLERIGDHTTNIAENVYYLVHGKLIGEERPKKDLTSITAIDPR